ncbi:MAG: peptide chain release factor 3 [Spirochaetaceae bacterium]|nr:peptide chain release factor 3 [Spirochaetaceae bacterium]
MPGRTPAQSDPGRAAEIPRRVDLRGPATAPASVRPPPRERGPQAVSTERSPEEIRREIRRRRTFAIISHPDAGKTTLTEKLLLYGGALREAGAVRAQKAARHATSDWLELEKQRGISVSSSVLHFEFGGHRVNILDTPGHRDFSEDTYRTLMAADSAVMLIDAARGVEPQTRKLCEVCRLRQIPIFTFVNKMDRHGRDPLDIMSEIEEVLGMDVVPANWPVGAGSDFRGIYDRLERRLVLFSGGDHGTHRVDEEIVAGEPADPEVARAMGPFASEVADGLELLEGAGAELDAERVGSGSQTPMFFGSALTNFGVRPFLERYLEMAPGPVARQSGGEPVDPVTRPFSGFVFKIQANMDPDHRDRVAFLRICSGRFVKGRQTTHVRTGKPIRLANSTLLMGKDREEVEEAFAGDVVGLFDPGLFRIGDTLSDEPGIAYAGIPIFAPESFMRVEVAGVQKRKALEKGVEQLVQEGVVQLFRDPDGGSASWILGAMGPLQFDVMKHRLQTEYGVELKLSNLPYTIARWPQAGFAPEDLRYSERIRVVKDRDDGWALLAHSPWDFDRLCERNESLVLAETPDPSLFESAR